MINTELHNQLIEKEIANKLIQADKVNQIAKTSLLKEKLKSVLLIIGVVFLVLLLSLFLYWLFPSKDSSNTSKETECKKQKIEQPLKQEQKFVPNEVKTQIPSKKQMQEKSNNNPSKGTPKNGTEFLKYDNYVYKRVWKDGYLVEETKLKETIEDSRKDKDIKIPQLAIPQKNK